MVTSNSFDPLEFLRVAESLADTDASEADLRTAVGRIYYAVFLAARERFRVRGVRNVHGRVNNALSRYDIAAGNQFVQLKALRILADYRLQNLDVLDRNWNDNYRKARRFAAFILERLS